MRQAEAQAGENSTLMQQVGSGSLGIAARALNRLIKAQSGELVTMVPVRDLPQLMRAKRG